MRPVSIVRFEQAYLAALLLGVLNILLSWDMLSAAYSADPNAAVLGTGFLIGSLAVSYGISLLLWFLTARKASSIAKWFLVVLFAFGVLSLLYSLAMGSWDGGLTGLFGVVGLLLQAVAVYFLFRPDARAWFATDDIAEGTFE
ncbi:hypothetical protein OKW76_04805 [Sphingomonas sp. S1-29]|uniref:hypothetical protein n=1 Tax=Sphingomonas sp. S1-29 TaxID=2991074 RepID=UPI00223F5721|nr:hypothetical protein [Sphingomonas sp. S1-29]UZK70369.1 hypothetical protein OKW76_04805 [Sphingomonas sp. S1-29]